MSQYQDDEGPDIPALREAAKRGDAAAKERDEALRRLALVEAGVDTKSPIGKMFTKSYDGPLKEDAIKAAWEELIPATGNPAPPPVEEPEPTAPAATEEQRSETEQRRLLTSNGAGDTPNEKPPPDPVAAGFEQMQERLKKGEGRDVAAGSVFAHLFEGASNGDERAIWSGWKAEDMSR